MRYFISGHGWLSKKKFEEYYVPVLERILEHDMADHEWVVGDFKGVDIMAQQWLVDHGQAQFMTVYHMFDKPRNLATGCEYYCDIKTVGGFKSDEERDAAMTANSDFDIAFVFRANSGTERNIKRRHIKIGDKKNVQKASKI